LAGIGSGVGGYFAIAEGVNTAADYAVLANFVAPDIMVPVKTAKGTYNPHKVQGGPYIRYLSGSGVIDIGSANVAVYLDAQLSITGDFINTNMSLLLAQVFGGLALPTPLTFAATGATAYTVTDTVAASGSPAGLYVQDGTWIDAELAVPDTGGTLHYQDYVNGKITKAEFVFPRDNIVTFAYDLDYAFVVETDTPALFAGTTEPVGFVPFTMPNASSLFKVGGTSVDGCRKATVTLTPKLATDRAYIGREYKEEPITNGLIEVAVALDMDYTPTSKSDIFDLFIGAQTGGSGAYSFVYPYYTPLGSTVIQAVGGQIASSGSYDTFELILPQLIIQSGGEAPLEGLDIVKNTINLKGVISNSGVSPSFSLTSKDSGFSA
jgi:hypothetical protein